MLVIKTESEVHGNGPELALHNCWAYGTPYVHIAESYIVIAEFPAPGGSYFLLVKADTVHQPVE